MPRFVPLAFIFVTFVISGCNRQAAPVVVQAVEVPNKTSFELDEPPPKARATVGPEEAPRKKAVVREEEDEPGEPEMPSPKQLVELLKAFQPPPGARAPRTSEEPEEAPEERPVRKQPNPVLKVWEIGQDVPSYNRPGVTLSLLKVELRRNKRTRWQFTVMNRSNDTKFFDLSLAKSYLADGRGNRYPCLGDSMGTGRGANMEVQIQEGIRFDYWIEWDAPPEDVKSFDVSLSNRIGLSEGASFRRFSVQLPDDEEEEEGAPKSKVDDEDGPIVVKAKKHQLAAKRAKEVFEAVAQNFEDVGPGELPEGWSSDKGNIAVKKLGGGNGLTLLDAGIPGQVTFLTPRMTGKFHLEITFEMKQPGAGLQLRMEGPAAKPPLSVAIKGDGQLFIQDKPKKSLTHILLTNGAKNTLIVERGAGGYILKLNGSVVTFPSATAPGTFEMSRLTLSGKEGTPSPVIRSIDLAPPGR